MPNGQGFFGDGLFSQGFFGQGGACVFGQVLVIPTGLIGAVNGYIFTLMGLPIRFRQVVGPAGGPVSVNTVNGQLATLCGNVLADQGEIVLNVTAVLPGGGPLGLQGLAGLGGLGSLGGVGGPGSLGSLVGSGRF